MIQWNFGNTTVRNPERIRDGLRILADEFAGQTFSSETQDKFFNSLLKNGIIRGDPGQAESRRESARKWASAFNKLGFAKCWQSTPPIQVTAPGQALLEMSGPTEELFLRQLWKVQLPSAVERRSKSFKVHPLYVVVSIAYALHKRRLIGITREEISAFVQTTIRDEDIERVIEQIIKYREARGKQIGKVSKRRFYLGTLQKLVAQKYATELDERFALISTLNDRVKEQPNFLRTADAREKLREVTRTGKGSNVKSAAQARNALVAALRSNKPTDELKSIVEEHVLSRKMFTLMDYSDTTVRYSRMTGLFTVTADKLALREDRVDLAHVLLKTPPSMLSKDDFLNSFYDCALPGLPTDDQRFVLSQIDQLQSEISKLGEKPLAAIPRFPDISQLKTARQKLEQQILTLKEIDFYRRQAQEDQLAEIRDVFDSIQRREIIGGSDYLPAWAEWAVWRVLLAIDSIKCPINKTRNFEIDSELNPIHNARPGVSDMVFEYEGQFMVPVEVTLNTGENQYSAEGEPVPRHVRDIAENNAGAEVIALFVAPSINPTAAHEFFKGDIYSMKTGTELHLSIIPLTMKQLVTLMPGGTHGCGNPDELHAIMKQLLDLRNGCSVGRDWVTKIDQWFNREYS